LIEQLLAKYLEIKWFLEKNNYMKKEVFVEFLTLMKLVPNHDDTFPNKIFLLFDEESTGEINFKLFLFIMELTSKTSSDIEKIIFYVELFSDLKIKNKNECINVLEMYEILKHLINSSSHTKEYKYLYDLLKNEFNEGEKIDINLYINKQQLYQFFLNNKFIQKLLQNFWIQYKYADIIYNEEINSGFNSTVKNAKKFLNQQNEITEISINECSNLEKVLKAIKAKEKAEIGIKNLNNDLNNISTQNED
jgi:Ca2+-binding EF-hand superfamily protein